jgi:phosphoesterase RecJ-like protein
MFTVSEKNKLNERLCEGCNVVVSTHKSPDGDAIGSAIALAHYLVQKGCLCTIVVPDGLPKNLQWIPGADQILLYTENEAEVKGAVESAEFIFSLDYNDLSRAGEIGPLISASNSLKVLIDHHEDPKQFADFVFHDAACCSTAQLVFNFIDEFDDLYRIDMKMAIGIYVGLITDTGSFRYPSVNARTHEIASYLINFGLKHEDVHEAIYGENSINQLQLNGFAISERLELLQNGQVALIYLEKEDLKRFKAEKGDTEGLVNKALSISGVKLAAFFREDKGLIKISFRSKGDVFVNALAKENFGGGGHKYAAGGASRLNMNDTLSAFRTIIDEYV